MAWKFKFIWKGLVCYAFCFKVLNCTLSISGTGKWTGDVVGYKNASLLKKRETWYGMEREKIFYCHTIFNRKVMQTHYDINQSIFSSETILRLGLLFLQQTNVSKNWETIYMFKYFSEYLCLYTHFTHFNLSLLSK